MSSPLAVASSCPLTPIPPVNELKVDALFCRKFYTVVGMVLHVVLRDSTWDEDNSIAFNLEDGKVSPPPSPSTKNRKSGAKAN